MDVVNSLLIEVEAHVTNFITEHVDKKFAYHNIQHTLDVVNSTKQLSAAHNLHSKELELLLIAAWFHDIGYDKGPLGHEERSCNYAKTFLEKYDFEETDIKLIQNCIMATKMPQSPNTLFEKILCDDAEYLIVAYGSSARISQKAVELARKKGIKVGLLRPITLFPYPKQALFELADQVKGILSVELNAGQMVEDVKLSVEHKVPVEHFGRTGGIIHTPEEVLEALEQKIIK